MKRRTVQLVAGLAALSVVLVYSGCSKNPASVVLNSDEAAIRELIENDPELFNVLGIDDDGAQDPEYAADLSKPMDAIIPLRFGRRGRFRLEEINIEFSVNKDTAIVTVVRSFDGNFIIVARDTTTSPVFANVYKKPMTNTITRKAKFVKLTEATDARRKWRLVGITMSDSYSDDCTITIDELRIVTPDTEIVVTAPLDYYMNGREGIPTMAPGDTVKVYVTLTNSNNNPPEPGETVLLHYGTNHMHRRARRPFNDMGEYPDEIAGDGIYSGYWVVRQHPGIFHAFVDVIDNGTIYDDTLPYDSAIWGSPYKVAW